MVKDSTENSETVPNFGLGISYMDSMQYALSRYALCMHDLIGHLREKQESNI